MNPVAIADVPARNPQGDIADQMATLSLEQVAQLSGVGAAALRGLVDYGVLKPVSEPWTFPLDCVMKLQRADHLRHDLALDDHGFALAMMLLSQITSLEDELRTARPQMDEVPAEGHLEGRAN